MKSFFKMTVVSSCVIFVISFNCIMPMESTLSTGSLDDVSSWRVPSQHSNSQSSIEDQYEQWRLHSRVNDLYLEVKDRLSSIQFFLQAKIRQNPELVDFIDMCGSVVAIFCSDLNCSSDDEDENFENFAAGWTDDEVLDYLNDIYPVLSDFAFLVDALFSLCDQALLIDHLSKKVTSPDFTALTSAVFSLHKFLNQVKQAVDPYFAHYQSDADFSQCFSSYETAISELEDLLSILNAFEQDMTARLAEVEDSQSCAAGDESFVDNDEDVVSQKIINKRKYEHRVAKRAKNRLRRVEKMLWRLQVK